MLYIAVEDRYPALILLEPFLDLNLGLHLLSGQLLILNSLNLQKVYAVLMHTLIDFVLIPLQFVNPVDYRFFTGDKLLLDRFNPV